jgi:hypothetical protein
MDEFVTNTGDKAKMMLTLHGRSATYRHPKSRSSLIKSRRIAFVCAACAEKVFHGPKLELQTEISTLPGSDSFQIKDQVMNRSAYEQEFQSIYHANYGSPLLEPGAQLLVPTKKVMPMNEHAANAVESYATYRSEARIYRRSLFNRTPRG